VLYNKDKIKNIKKQKPIKLNTKFVN